jgi:hypothetical protein
MNYSCRQSSWLKFQAQIEDENCEQLQDKMQTLYTKSLRDFHHPHGRMNKIIFHSSNLSNLEHLFFAWDASTHFYNLYETFVVREPIDSRMFPTFLNSFENIFAPKSTCQGKLLGIYDHVSHLFYLSPMNTKNNHSSKLPMDIFKLQTMNYYIHNMNSEAFLFKKIMIGIACTTIFIQFSSKGSICCLKHLEILTHNIVAWPIIEHWLPRNLKQSSIRY